MQDYWHININSGFSKYINIDSIYYYITYLKILTFNSTLTDYNKYYPYFKNIIYICRTLIEYLNHFFKISWDNTELTV